MAIQVQALNIFPVKGFRGQELKQMPLLQDGPVGDRQWMLVDAEGKFISQRHLPKLATIDSFFDDRGLTIGYQKRFFLVPKSNSFKRTLKVQIWNEEVEAALEPDLYSQALSEYLGVNVRLVRYTPNSQRRVNSTREDWNPEVRFADGRPLLLTNEASLEDLNARIGSSSVTMDRFRANVVVRGATAFAEDTWKRIRIGEVSLSQPKKCIRCKVTTFDPQTGESLGVEPLKTLATFRREEKGVSFGMLWIPENEGVIRLEDSVEILE